MARIKHHKRAALPGEYMQMSLFGSSIESDWTAPEPADWPDFRAHAEIIGVDTETCDPYLESKGPGFIRGDAFVCGVGLAAEDGTKVYLPMRHAEGNLDPEQVKRYLRHQLGGNQEKCGANLMYDMEALHFEGVDLKGDLADIQIAEPLIREEAPKGFGLEALAKYYLNETKNEELLDQVTDEYGLPAKKIMHKIPAKFVGPYGEDDALLPIRIYEKQLEFIDYDNLDVVYDVERRLTQVLFKMRLRGVRVDLERAEELSRVIKIEEQQIRDAIWTMAGGYRVNVESSEDLGRTASRLDLPTKTTTTGKYSVTADWLKEQDDPFWTKVAELRKMEKMRRDFIDKLAEDHIDGRIYSNWHQLRAIDQDGATKGTRSGRIAASRFNLTQVPSRDPKWGPMIRSLFIADEGAIWGKADYSQQEPRLLLHFAYARKYPGAAEARQRYLDDPSTDYHQLVADMVKEMADQDIGRRPAKDINLGSSYGMGKHKLALKLGVSLEVDEEILEAYHKGVPYVKKFEEEAMMMAQDRGFVRTLLGRRRRFNWWEPVDYKKRHKWGAVLGQGTAKHTFGGLAIQRAFTHKALNGIIQGSAADQMKQALLLLDEAGVCPQIQVYDETDGSYASVEEIRLVKKIMEEAIKTNVPHLVEPEAGPSWGETSPC